MSDQLPPELESILASISHEDLRNQLRIFLEFRGRNHPELGMADIICLGQDVELRSLTAFALGTLLFPIKDKPTFKTAYIVLHGTKSASTTVKEYALKILLDLSPTSESENAAGFLKSILKFHHPASYEAEELLNYLRTVPPHSTVIVHNAAGYRGGPDTSENTEDEWVQQIIQLVHSINNLPISQHLYIQLLTGRLAPRSQAHIDALFALPGSVFGEGRASKQALATEQALREWVALSEAGQLEHALSEIDKSQLNTQAQAITRALCLNAAHRYAQAFEQVKPLLTQLLQTEGAENLTIISRLATEAKDKKTAQGLLHKALERSTLSLTVLCRICQLSWQLDDHYASSEAQGKILSLYPTSGLKALVELRLRHGNLRGLSDIIKARFPNAESTPEWALYGAILSDAFSVPSPNISDTIINITRQLPAWADQAALDSARFAINHSTLKPDKDTNPENTEPINENYETSLKLRWHSVALDALEAREFSSETWPAAADVAIELLSDLLLSIKKKLHDDSLELKLLHRALKYALRYVAKNPQDQARRAQLSQGLSTEAAGTNGIILLLWATLKTPVSVHIKSKSETPLEGAPHDVFMSFFTQYWSQKKTTTDGGVPLITEPLDGVDLPAPPPALLRAGMLYLDHMAWRFIAGDLDVKTLLMVLKTCIDLAEASSEITSPAELLRVAADGIADAGAHQEARDLAEQAFVLRGPEVSDKERWFAWITYSDVYHRLGNPHEALLGWLCAHAHDDITATSTEIFPTIALLARIFRDLSFYEPAKKQAARARQLLEVANLLDANEYRVNELEASIDLKRLTRSDDASEQEWGRLAQTLTTSVQDALEHVNNAVVSTALLAQVIRRFQLAGWTVPTTTNEAFNKALELLGEPQASKLRVLASPSPTLESIKHFSWGLSKVRYVRDLAEDLRRLSLIAKRALGTAAYTNDPISALLSIELLADHTIGLASSSPTPDQIGEQREPNSALEVLNNPAALIGFATRLSKDSLEIHAIGQSEDGKLIHVTTHNEEIFGPKLETLDVFSRQRLEQWRKEYPIQYPHDHDKISDINALEQRMRGIGISGPVHGRELVLVRENALSDIPANLLLCEGRLLGAQVPTSTVPSLTWLKTDMSQQQPLPSRRVAWLLPSDESGSSPLSLLHEDLRKILPAHSVDVIQGADPGSLSDSGLAIIAGHGSVWGRERYFKQLRGEDLSSFKGTDIAGTIRGSGIVVLLVCSAGRLDRDLFSSRSIGLPHQLLKQRCRAIVASPWPIKFTLAGQWLNWFLEALGAGMTVSESTYYANCELRDRHWRVSDFLAMHVIGNPFLKLA